MIYVNVFIFKQEKGLKRFLREFDTIRKETSFCILFRTEKKC